MLIRVETAVREGDYRRPPLAGDGARRGTLHRQEHPRTPPARVRTHPLCPQALIRKDRSGGDSFTAPATQSTGFHYEKILKISEENIFSNTFKEFNI